MPTLLVSRQGNESLCDFTNKFMKMMNDVIDLDTGITFIAYVRGLCPNSWLVESPTIHKVRTFTELFARSQLYIESKELNESKLYDNLKLYPNFWGNKRPHFNKRR